ncbi:lipoprotein [Kurthia zopfii]|uniref:Lipoprotein n=1 Tax=Kurthia zopfii TaxID=1650 RepID=A0A2U3AGQ2_9BACL|nr:MetQ/NlpA family ABC transporter substrate-binding protein [Kurthia zopfii]PWI23631.1 methionine ABC transporter substrate-binding protein [Kurthia zopfii]TDR42688.1 D-methionine transport system substrate-binding protein [Kurthia zopfii]STX10475.1 Methionine-binding lipoprotein metQ precursor [Kurthia zopfii]VEI06154.1 Methionine-binding lipoprotein metQ precursor [Kurthia zopfii]GEK30160.1 lipoprotein [Kurthia zopfii]
MKNSKKLLAGILTGALALSLAACGSDKDSGDGKETTLTIGASNVPHAKILEKAEPILEKEGIKLDIETYQDYVLPNKDLESKDLDANFFQHKPYLEQQIKDNGYDFVSAGGVHIEPIGIYSKKHKTLEDLPKGATILISNSVADQGRILTLLETKGLITLKEGVNKDAAQIKDIDKNPKDLKIDAKTAPEMLVQMYKNEEGDAVIINSNYAIDAGLTPTKDSISIEDSESPYVNVIAVRKGDEDKKEIKELMKALHSKEIQDYINEEWEGSVVPVKE